MWLAGVHIWSLLIGPKLEKERRLGKLSVINQILAIWGLIVTRGYGLISNNSDL